MGAQTNGYLVFLLPAVLGHVSVQGKALWHSLEGQVPIKLGSHEARYPFSRCRFVVMVAAGQLWWYLGKEQMIRTRTFIWWTVESIFARARRVVPCHAKHTHRSCRHANRHTGRRTHMHTSIHAYTHKWHTRIHAYYTHTRIHAYMHTRIHAYTHTRIHAYTHTCIHACVRTCIHAYMHAYMHTCIHAYMHTCIHGYIYIHTRAHSYTLVCNLCMHTCTYMHQTHTHTHMQTHTAVFLLRFRKFQSRVWTNLQLLGGP